MKIRSQLTSSGIVLIFSLFYYAANAQGYNSGMAQKKSDFRWPEGRKMALSLSFDDARLSQPDLGIPLLDKYGVKATFYVSPDNMLQRTDAWRKAVR